MREAVVSSSQAPRPPAHIAIIMDGNGRWAKARGLPRVAGHQRGAEAARIAVRTCRELGVKFLTLYAFSSENWKRPASEVDDLMALLRYYLRREVSDLTEQDVRLRFIGSRERLAPDIISEIEHAEARTQHNSGLTLVVALNYGSHEEIVQAARSLAQDVANGVLKPSDIDENTFAERLSTSDIPDPDLLIRTSGEQRLSNFLLWQAAYSELVFLDTYWPDFSRENLETAIAEFHRRDRRFGTTNG
ncbi:MAG: isoprenyl transferase [Alphaproteobacteria bacterium]|nr:isoprenyl transferase [Alphaproteobacteria bacterium]